MNAYAYGKPLASIKERGVRVQQDGLPRLPPPTEEGHTEMQHGGRDTKIWSFDRLEKHAASTCYVA
jgi:hypothetical protein